MVLLQLDYVLLTSFMLFSNFVIQSGLVYGWNGLSSQLKSEGQYSNLCPANNADGCTAQKDKFNFIFTIGANASTIGTVLFGLTLDKYGPRYNALAGNLCLTLGLFLIAFSSSHSFDAFAAGLGLVGLGGMANFMASFQFANLYSNPVLIRSILSALFSASAVIFTLLGVLYSYANVSRQTSYIVLGIIAAVYNLVIFLIYPDVAYRSGDPLIFPISRYLNKSHNPYSQPGDKLLDDEDNDIEHSIANVSTSNSLNGEEKLLSHQEQQDSSDGKNTKTFLEELKDPGTWLVSLFFSFVLLFLNIYIPEIGDILSHKSGDSDLYTSLFIYIISFQPVLNAWVFTACYHRLQYSGIVTINVTLAAVCWLPLFINNLPISILSFILYSLARSFITTLIFGYISTQYRSDHYGYIVAVATTLCAAVGFLQLELTDFIQGPLSGDLNILMILTSTAVLPFYYFAYWCKVNKV
jgi:MFS family permease